MLGTDQYDAQDNVCICLLLHGFNNPTGVVIVGLDGLSLDLSSISSLSPNIAKIFMVMLQGGGGWVASVGKLIGLPKLPQLDSPTMTGIIMFEGDPCFENVIRDFFRFV